MYDYMHIFLIISGLFASLLSFYDAYRVYKYRGISAKSKLEAMYTFSFFIIQTVLSSQYIFDENFLYPIIISLMIVFAIILYRLFVTGQVLVIKQTSKNIVIERVRSELNRLSISFTEEGFDFSDLHQFHLEDQTIIKVSDPWGGEKGIKTYQLSFRKWWRLYEYEEIKTNIIEKYREEREDEVYWKQILFPLD
ncbi:hypothetical protein V7149_26040 [Bacillus sp. JJ1503]|uniref:hypothetical protein n=1 Tax=Bacillus sp. JJ1503 TaxID=3122956 RepID=UPI002FFFE825